METEASSNSTSVKLTTDDEEQFVFFYGNKFPFSQHYPAKFTVDGVRGAGWVTDRVTFKDEEMKEKILATDNPVQQKKYGRMVKNFDKDIWNEESVTVVKTASLAKYDQNEDLRKELFATYPKTLVEASPRDNIWGIGMGANNPKAKDKSAWRGKNKLGYILTEVRDELMEQYKE